ncbi:MAG: nucleotidyltransferase domain-containing protein, partial [Candidatus Omnitrophica bacterium]|nr:nucleotidyltransferase domain-containing protein [Candidatus Omnitrophota bacterium]
MDKKEIINRIIEKVKTQYQPEKIIIFGSSVWGKPKKDSDIDLFIVKKTNEKHRERALKVRRILREENALVGIDILVYTPEELAKRLEIADSFINKIIKKG